MSTLLTLALTLALPPAAMAGDVTADFPCCRTLPTTARTTTPRDLVLVPLADQREQVVSDPADQRTNAHLVGMVRGQFGNPWPLTAPQILQAYVTQALVAQLQAAGHRVTVEEADAPAPGSPPLSNAELGQVESKGLVIHGSIQRWLVDVAPLSSRTTTATLALIVVDPATQATVWTGQVTVDEKAELDSNAWSPASLVGLADAMYGKKKEEWRYAAAVELGLAATAATLVKPGTGAGDFFLGTPSPNPAP